MVRRLSVVFFVEANSWPYGQKTQPNSKSPDFGGFCASYDLRHTSCASFMFDFAAGVAGAQGVLLLLYMKKGLNQERGANRANLGPIRVRSPPARPAIGFRPYDV